MLSKEIKSAIRCFYRTIIKKGHENNEPIKLGYVSSLNLKTYELYDWSCDNPDFPDFFSAGSNGKYNSLRDTLILLSKQSEGQDDINELRSVTAGIRNDLYKSKPPKLNKKFIT